MNSRIGTLNAKDLIKGAVMAVGSSILTIILTALQGGGNIDWTTVGKVALIATLTYVLKQLSTDSNGNIAGIE